MNQYEYKELSKGIHKTLDIISARAVMNNSKYVNDDNKSVPRVTNIIDSMWSDPHIAEWANSLGWKKKGYRKTLNEFAAKGTHSHAVIEDYILHGIEPDYNRYPEFARSAICNSYTAFRQWWDKLCMKHDEVDVVFVEKTLICKYFGGTLDCLLKIDDKYVLLDFKTSKDANPKYALQLAAYRYMLRELEGITIDACMNLIVKRDSPTYIEYIYDLKDPNHKNFINLCENEFLSLVQAYYGRQQVESGYKEIFHK